MAVRPIIMSLCAAGLLCGQTLAADAVVRSASLRMECAATDGHLRLTSLRDTRGHEWATTSSKQNDLWKITLTGPEKATAELASETAQFAGVEAGKDTATSTWKCAVKGESATVTLSVSGAAQDPLLHWNLQATLPKGWIVDKAECMRLPNLALGQNLKLAAPVGWGLEYPVKPGMGWGGIYPSLTVAMPFAVLSGDSGSLYLAVHDPKGYHKVLNVNAREDGLAFACTDMAAASQSADGAYKMGFDGVIGAVEGGWLDAAQLYREFVVANAPWGRGRSAIASLQWIGDIDLWLMPDPQPVENVAACVKAKEFFGVPIGLHWYNWHEIPFDTLYPEYFPAKPKFKEGVKALQNAGFRVMPYINGRLCDGNAKTFNEEHGDRAAARQANGELYTEVYGSKVPLHVMCPATGQWRNKIVGIVDRLVNECGVDGVYIDQITAAYAQRCYAEGHGHSPGGGTFWVDGYRQMMKEIRTKLPANRMLTSEENAECWNDQFDGLLMANTPNGDRRIIPMMPAVYGDRVFIFGFQYMSAADFAKPLSFRAKMARAFTWGSQLGWVNIGLIMQPSAIKEAELLRSLARCRHGAHELVVNGRFLGELDVTGDNPLLSDGLKVKLPSVLASAWQGRDGVMGVLAANMSDEAREVQIALPLRAWGIGEQASISGEAYGAEGKLGSVATASGKLAVSIPAREGRVFRIIAHP